MSPLRYAPDAATIKQIEDLGAKNERDTLKISNLLLTPTKLLAHTNFSYTPLDLYQKTD